VRPTAADPFSSSVIEEGGAPASAPLSDPAARGYLHDACFIPSDSGKMIRSQSWRDLVSP